jgi:hypothetical protein
MKIGALYSVAEDEHIFLKVSLQSIKNLADEIIAIFDSSKSIYNIHSIGILKKYNAKIFFLDQLLKKKKIRVPRDILLDIARKRKITHFIWLDCDEAFTKNFSNKGRNFIKKLKPGQKILMPWFSMWKNYKYYRVDQKSVWSNLYKDFIVYDDPSLSFNKKIFYHEGRTQGLNNLNSSIKLNLEKGGAVMHYQFLPWNHFQMKQAFYRCHEYKFIKFEDSEKINRRYYETLYENNPKLQMLNSKYYSHLPIKDLQNIKTKSDDYYFKRIKDFLIKNVSLFEDLDIWHISKLKEFFFIKKNRYPRKNLLKKILYNLFLFKLIIKNILRKF